jgi:uncharacterized repeat protein (TIGR01451 family)
MRRLPVHVSQPPSSAVQFRRTLALWTTALLRRSRRLLPLAVVFSLVLQFIPLGLPAPSHVVNQLLATSASLGHRLLVLPAWLNPDTAAVSKALAPADRLVAGLGPRLAYAKETAPTTLEFTKVCEPDPVNQGELITYTLYITNTGSVTASILITDPLPVNVTFEAYNNPLGSDGGANWYQNSDPDSDGYVRFFTGDYFDILNDKGLPPGNSAARRFTVRVTVPMTDLATIDNSVVLTANIASELSDFCGVTVNAPRFEMAKTPNSPVVDAGDPLTFTVYITNTGHLTATQPFTVTDRIPDGTSYLTSTLPSTYANRTITWTLDTDLGQDQVVTRTFVVTVTSPYTNGAVITNTAYRVWSSEVITVAEGDPVTVTVRSSPALSLTKTADPDPVQAGELLTYTLTLTNQTSGNGHAQNVVVTDTVPPSTWLQSASAAVPGTSIVNDGVAPGSLITWTLPTDYSLLWGESTQFTFTVRVHSPEVSGTLIANAAYGVTATNATVPTAGDPLTTTINSSPDLTVTKAVDPSSILAGGFVTYTVVITNNGNETATGVTITDTLPVSFTYGGMVQGPAPNGSPTNVITWTGQTVTGTVINRPITPGPLTLVFTATTDAALAEGTVHSNTVTATYSLGDVSTGPTAPVTIVKPILAITKTDYPDPVDAGATLLYTITVRNEASQSGSVATSLVITDDLSYVSSITDWTSGGTYDEDFVITWTVGILNPGESRVFTVTAEVSSPLTNGLVITNTAWVTSAQGVNNSDTETTTVRSAPILNLTKTDDPDPVAAGATLLYTLTVGNDPGANMNASGVVVTDVVPINTTFITATASGLTFEGPDANRAITWTLPGTLDLGNSVLLTYTTQVISPLPNGTVLTNTAWVTSAQGVGDSTTETTTVSSAPILTLTKDDYPDPVDAGATLLYTITVANDAAANGPATGVVITDVVPANTTFVATTLSGLTFEGPDASDVMTWTLGSNIAPGGSVVITFTVDVASPLPNGTILNNTAWVTSAEGVGDSDTETTQVQSSTALTLTKSASSAVVDAGTTLTYTIAVTNLASANEVATGVVITDVVPGDTGFVSASPPVSAGPDGNGVITWTLLSSIDPDDGVVVTFTVAVTSPLTDGTVITNTAWVTLTQGQGASDTVTTTVRSVPILSLTKVDDLDPVDAGATLLYTLTVANDDAANGPATGVVITDVVPANTTFLSATPTGFSGPTGGVITWTLASAIMPGSSVVVTFAVDVDSPLANGTILTNDAWVTSTQGVGDTDTETTTVQSSPSLALTKTDDPDPVAASGILTYTVTVINLNTANATATGVAISDTVPGNTTFIAASASCTEMGGLINCTLADLDPGDSASITFTVQVDAGLADGTELGNTASVTSAQGVGATDTETTTVYAPDLAVTKSALPTTFVRPSETITYVIVFTNTGSIDATGVRITDTLPVSASLVTSQTLGASFDSGSGQTYAWISSTVAPGSVGVITITAQVTTTPGWINPDGGTAIQNGVVITSATPDGNLADNQDSASTTVYAGLPATLTLTAAPTTTPVGSSATITAAVTDQWGNLVMNQDNITVTLASSLVGSQITPPTVSMALGQGTATITSTAVGVAFITGTVGAYPTVTDTAQVAFTAGALDHFTFDPIGDQVAGVNFAVTITAYDQFSNVVDYDGVVTLQDLGSATLQPTTSDPFVNGLLAGQVISITLARVDQPIRAISGTINIYNSNPFTVSAGTPTNMTLTALPDTVAVGTNAALTAQLYDAFSNPVPGEDIDFTSLNLGGGGIVPATDTTDVAGQATSSISSTLLGVRTVTATLVSNPSVDATTLVTFTAGPPAVITLTIAPATNPVGASAQMTATVEDAYANPVAGWDVAFSTGDPLGTGDIVPDIDATDAAGVATSVISSTLSGVKTVLAQAVGTSVTDTAPVTFTAGTLDHFAVGPVADPQTAGVAFTLVMTAQDQFNNTVTGFSGNVNMADSTGTLAPTTSGAFASGLRSENIVITLAQQNVTIVVTNTAGSETGTSNAFDVVANVPATITLQVNPVNIPLQGTASLTATVTDAWSNLVANGTVVTFTTAAGVVSPGTDTTVNGQATSQLTADCVERPSVVVTAAAGTAFTSTTVAFVAPGAPQSVTVVAAPANIPVGTGTAVVTATVGDCRPGPVPGQLVNFATSLGSLAPGSGTTDANGIVTVTLSAGTVAGTAYITATADGFSDSTTVVIDPGPPDSVAVTANPSSIPANGAAASTIAVTVTDQYGNIVADGTAVTLDYSPTALGTLAPLSFTTVGGGGTATFTADYITGTVTITATSGSAVGVTLLTLTQGIRYVFLPLVTRNYTPPPPYDLVVESVTWIPSPPVEGQAYQVQIVVRNDGTMTVTEDFWVDLYLRPSTTPGVNQTWNMISLAGYGKAWLVRDDIGPGQTVTLLTSDPDDPDNPSNRYSYWPPPLFDTSHNPFYVLVDSWGDSYGLVDEGTGEDNNLWGPASASGLGGAGAEEMRRKPGTAAPPSGPRPPFSLEGGWAPRILWWG